MENQLHNHLPIIYNYMRLQTHPLMIQGYSQTQYMVKNVELQQNPAYMYMKTDEVAMDNDPDYNYVCRQTLRII